MWSKIIEEEIDMLKDANFIIEVHYPDLLANVVLVQKKNRKWRICVDFSYLNKACPKNPYILPQIDLLVNFTTGHEQLSFMDAYSNYKPDMGKHHFGLKNIGASIWG